MADKRSVTSAKNGAKGGRPVSEATIRATLAREYISQEVEKSLAPIVAKAINDAILGEKYAREWLSGYAWGKPMQPLSGPLDTPLFDNEHYQKSKEVIADYLGSTGEEE